MRHERPDQVDGIEEELAAEGHVEGPLGEEFEGAGVAMEALARRHRHDVPLDVRVEAFHVDAVLERRELLR